MQVLPRAGLSRPARSGRLCRRQCVQMIRVLPRAGLCRPARMGRRLLPPRKTAALARPWGRRATGCAREAVKANAMIYAFARTERRTWMGYTDVPAGAPCEARGSAACGTAALFWVLFWCQKSIAAQLFVLAPQGALLSLPDGTCEDKRYPSAVSMISCEAKETLAAETGACQEHSARRFSKPPKEEQRHKQKNR